MALTLTRVTACADDVLEIRAEDADGNEVIAYGWQSAMTNYYPPKSYDTEGNLVDGAAAREMTAKEQKAYWQSLVDAAAPTTAAAPVVLFGE